MNFNVGNFKLNLGLHETPHTSNFTHPWDASPGCHSTSHRKYHQDCATILWLRDPILILVPTFTGRRFAAQDIHILSTSFHAVFRHTCWTRPRWSPFRETCAEVDSFECNLGRYYVRILKKRKVIWLDLLQYVVYKFPERTVNKQWHCFFLNCFVLFQGDCSALDF